MKRYLAVDLGASSGRHIVGWRENGRIQTQEVYRFPNAMQRRDGHLVWDTGRLLSEVKNGLRAAFAAFGEEIESFSVDAWGVDYVLMSGDEERSPCFAYRDGRTQNTMPLVHGAVPFSELYTHTGCQCQPFNTIYQLYDDLLRGRLKDVTDFLMIPEYLLYKLTGVRAKEYTNATTTGLVNPETGRFDEEIIRRLRLPDRLFPETAPPGTALGTLLPEVAAETGGQCRAVLCATHDTASAVHGIPMDEGDGIYISSGTWSLVGVKTPEPIISSAGMRMNCTNEGGVGYNRYIRSSMGLWLVQRLRAELCPELGFGDVVKEAEQSGFELRVDADSPFFYSPDSMKMAFDRALGFIPQDRGDYFRCAFLSLAESYRRAVEDIELSSGRAYERIYIVGGGAKNGFLNSLTGLSTGKSVIALPIEASALGNLKVQMEADGVM